MGICKSTQAKPKSVDKPAPEFSDKQETSQVLSPDNKPSTSTNQPAPQKALIRNPSTHQSSQRQSQISVNSSKRQSRVKSKNMDDELMFWAQADSALGLVTDSRSREKQAHGSKRMSRNHQPEDDAPLALIAAQKPSRFPSRSSRMDYSHSHRLPKFDAHHSARSSKTIQDDDEPLHFTREKFSHQSYMPRRRNDDEPLGYLVSNDRVHRHQSLRDTAQKRPESSDRLGNQIRRGATIVDRKLLLNYTELAADSSPETSFEPDTRYPSLTSSRTFTAEEHSNLSRDMSQLNEEDSGGFDEECEEEDTNSTWKHSNTPKMVLENVTVDDFNDIDTLLNDIDGYLQFGNKDARKRLSILSPSNLPLNHLLTPSPIKEESASFSDSFSQSPYNQDKINIAREKLAQMNIKKVSIRIYVNDARRYHSVLLTTLSTSEMVIQSMVADGILEDSPHWTLFELINDYCIERPLRDWEFVVKVISSWEDTSNNAIVIKKYGYREFLSAEDGIIPTPPVLSGWLNFKPNKQKWQERYFNLRNNHLYSYKDMKGNSETFICSFENHEVYTLIRPKKNLPTSYVFALKSQQSQRLFENPQEDYVKFYCAEDMDQLKDWLFAIRLTKNRLKYQDQFGLLPKESNSSSSEVNNLSQNFSRSASLTRQKSSKIPNPVAAFPTDHQVFKPGSLLDQPKLDMSTPDQVIEKKRQDDVSRFKPGSLLDNVTKTKTLTAQEKWNLKLKEKNHFHQGSLLQQNEHVKNRGYRTKQKLYDEQVINPNSLLAQNSHLFQKYSRDDPVHPPPQSSSSKPPMRSKTTYQPAKHPHTSSVSRHPSQKSPVRTRQKPTKPLLEMDLKPEESHSLQLKNNRYKPLLTFDSSKR